MEPKALRAAQLGYVLVGRVTIGHIAATLVDFTQRGLVRVAPVADADPADARPIAISVADPA